MKKVNSAPKDKTLLIWGLIALAWFVWIFYNVITHGIK